MGNTKRECQLKTEQLNQQIQEQNQKCIQVFEQYKQTKEILEKEKEEKNRLDQSIQNK